MNWLIHDVVEAPALTISAVLLGLMVGAAFLGRHLRGWHRRRFGEEVDSKGQEEIILSAVLGLLALLLGFTFSLAVDRYEARRRLVVDEANAIGTVYLRAQLLEEPHRLRMSRLLVQYTDNRIALAKAPPRRLLERLHRNRDLIHDIWTAAKASFPTIQGLDFSSAYLESVNALVELGSERVAERMVRVPPEVFFVLFIYMITTAGVVGYVLKGPQSHLVATFLLALLTLSLMLIIDVDRPRTGIVQESQAPMEDVRRAMQLWQPESFDRALPP